MFHFRTATELSRESEEWMRTFLAEALEPLANYQYKEKRGELIDLINALKITYSVTFDKVAKMNEADVDRMLKILGCDDGKSFQ